jgi:hypothetical protein
MLRNLKFISVFPFTTVIFTITVSKQNNVFTPDVHGSVPQPFFHPQHTLIYQRHMMAHHKTLPHEEGVQNYTWP